MVHLERGGTADAAAVTGERVLRPTVQHVVAHWVCRVVCSSLEPTQMDADSAHEQTAALWITLALGNNGGTG